MLLSCAWRNDHMFCEVGLLVWNVSIKVTKTLQKGWKVSAAVRWVQKYFIWSVLMRLLSNLFIWTAGHEVQNVFPPKLETHGPVSVWAETPNNAGQKQRIGSFSLKLFRTQSSCIIWCFVLSSSCSTKCDHTYTCDANPQTHKTALPVYSGVLFYLPENALAWKTGAAQSQFFSLPSNVKESLSFTREFLHAAKHTQNMQGGHSSLRC